MWAIAARTVGRVKENNDHDKRTRKEVKLSIKHKVGVVYEHVIFPLARVVCSSLFFSFFSVAAPLPFQPTILALP